MIQGMRTRNPNDGDLRRMEQSPLGPIMSLCFDYIVSCQPFLRIQGTSSQIEMVS